MGKGDMQLRLLSNLWGLHSVTSRRDKLFWTFLYMTLFTLDYATYVKASPLVLGFKGQMVEWMTLTEKSKHIKSITGLVYSHIQASGKENLCLYGFRSTQRKVSLCVEEVTLGLPEYALGINFTRHEMHDNDWSSLVAIPDDAYLSLL